MDRLGEDDLPLLIYAREQDYVICTFDSDYIDMAKLGVQHNGIVFVPNRRCEMGVMTRFLLLLYEVYDADDMKNRVEYLFG